MANYELLTVLSFVTLAAVLGIGVWQYRSVRRKQERMGEAESPEPRDPP